MRKTTVIVLVLGIALLAPVVVFAADKGEDIYKTKCVVCHGQMGNGKTPLGEKQKLRPLASPEVQKLTDAELTAMIADGGPAKKSSHTFKSKGLNVEQIKALVGYIRSLAAPKQ
ncbi:MAG TPA: cytochrome c [Thermoanaerobaculia bacterium]|nr:cytochrome c [Thermoanaerobaculia bacterium]